MTEGRYVVVPHGWTTDLEPGRRWSVVWVIEDAPGPDGVRLTTTTERIAICFGEQQARDIASALNHALVRS